MRRVQCTNTGELVAIMSKLQAIHEAVVVPIRVGDFGEFYEFDVYYEPHTNFRLEDWGEVWDENGTYVG